MLQRQGFLPRILADPVAPVQQIYAKEKQIVQREPAQMLDPLALCAKLECPVKECGLFRRGRAGNRRMRLAGLRALERRAEF